MSHQLPMWCSAARQLTASAIPRGPASAASPKPAFAKAGPRAAAASRSSMTITDVVTAQVAEVIPGSGSGWKAMAIA